jgi:biopolymer transport protein ExbB/TolQ
MNSVQLSPAEFFLTAGPVGRAVMILLLAASIWCWVLIIEGIVSTARFRGALRKWRRGETPAMLAPVITACRQAVALEIDGEQVSAARQRITEAMNRAARAVVADVDGGLANLAIISSVAPFIGLFGTVWGIMTSFTAIAASKDTSLAVVAPGIAEALSTTAIGLAAAIPASIGFTRIGASIGAGAQDLASQIEEQALAEIVAMQDVPATEAGQDDVEGAA